MPFTEPTEPAEPAAAEGSGVDVLQRQLQQARRQARAAEARYRLLWESAADAVLVVGDDHVILAANPATREVLGYAPEALVGRNLAVLQPARFRGMHHAAMARHLRTGQRRLNWRGTEAIALHAAGHEVPVEIAFSQMEFDGEHLFAAFVRDIRARQAQAAALRRSEERYRQIVETAQEGIWTVDAHGRTTFVNPAMAQMLGWTPQEMVGLHLASFMDEADTALALAHLERRMEGAREDLQFRLRHREGREVWTSMVCSPLCDEAGECVGALAMVSDVTARRAAEADKRELQALLAQSQKMEAVGLLAGGIAHDFNNIIAAILGNELLAREGLAPDHRAAAHLAQIRSAAQRARDMVRQLLAFSRKQPLQRQACDARALAREARDLLHAGMPASVALTLQLPPQPLWLSADATQVVQCLLNLGTNAWQAMGDTPGRIELRVAAVQLDAAEAQRAHLPAAGDYARLDVQDTGPGIAPALRSRLFEPFFTTKTATGGSGLGLSVVHGVVSSHGGAVTVDSPPGEGATFSLWLPLDHVGAEADADADTARAAAATRAASRTGARLLYVDDDEVLLLLVQQLLEREGYHVVTRRDPRQAARELAADPQAVDLLITDLNMPGMPGRELARLARSLRPALPVILTSGILPEPGEGDAGLAPRWAWLEKTAVADALVPLVARCLAAGAAGAAGGPQAGAGDLGGS